MLNEWAPTECKPISYLSYINALHSVHTKNIYVFYFDGFIMIHDIKFNEQNIKC